MKKTFTAFHLDRATRIILLFSVLALIFSGCSPLRPVVVTAIPSTATPTQPLPTVTFTLTPTQTSTSTPQPTVTLTPTLIPVLGLGISRQEAAQAFEFIHFTFKATTNAQGQEVYEGTSPNQLATIRLTGPIFNLKQATLQFELPYPPTDQQKLDSMTYLATMLTEFTPAWKEQMDWITTSLATEGESRALLADREVILNVKQSTKQAEIILTVQIPQTP